MVACPFAGTAAARPASTPSACPFASGAQGPNGDSQAAQHDEPAAVCPYGYGADAGPKLSELDCTICQTLLFDASKAVPCGHKFCRYCLSKFKDCPLCGADVAGIESAKDLQGLEPALLTCRQLSFW